ncbi:polysaccharide deacetylase [Paenibacillus amylolyticus]|uniref:polysaccharide deacetylase family protein n=1 Tax=Paenibacillus amylolyticus TaxID=1451 RepID=UPI00096D9EF0|nr:polysaccharide deacetylase family protein [Paenibacillus amylolyticus]OMF03834.1 polysaccharide deacetylase [Paenibacillus amylolyticus]
MGHRIQFDRYPGGVMRALTLSYDDGVVHDRRLVEICNRYGLRGTFNLNSGTLGNPGRIEAGEVAELYTGHEVAVHTVTHPTLPYVPNELLTEEIMEDRKALEQLVGYPVRGMAYPNGGYDRALSTKLEWLGIDYARTVESHGRYTLPERPLEWHPTCHHNHDLAGHAKRFIQHSKTGTPLLLYVWGHSYEFNDNDNWEIIEQFGEQIGSRNDIWYATNIEVIAYWKAVQRLECSADRSIIHNPSAIPVWFTADQQVVEVQGGETLRLSERIKV